MSFSREPDAEPIPGYRLIELLGTGGFGEVWKCEAPGGLYKAIKFVYGNLNSDDGDAYRAEQELSALNRVKEIRHPFVLSTEQIQIVDGEVVIVMELADNSLHDRFVECQAAGLVGIPRDDLLRYLRDAAEALDHMFEKHSLQHLDIKPRNLFLISDRVKVADFGLVKPIEPHSGMLNGITPLYAPPETFLGQVSQHSDQYSLAIVYQELLSGQRPFNGKTPRQLILQHNQEAPELRSLPEADRPVIARALAKSPDNRFPNCLAFVRALYQARSIPKPGAIAPEPSGSNGHAKSMVETMEDIALERVDDSDPSDPFAPAAEAAGAEDASQLGLTLSLPQTGALRPTLILGLGDFGRRALVDLRCRFFDRFGELSKVPLIRFLYADPDPEAMHQALADDAAADSPGDVYHLALQPVNNYRRRMLDQLSEWLPREKLYAMPRSLQTNGCRALGRLAFADNHLRFLGRLRHEIQQAAHPDTLYESVEKTGLALRDNKPRVYVIAAAGGGSSGLIVDLGYSLRRVLKQLRLPQAEVIAFLFCGAPEDPATPAPELANVHATLTELNHFADPAIPFTAQYGPDTHRVQDDGKPFQQVYVLKVAHRSPESLRSAVAHLGSYLFHELTTPLGLRLDTLRAAIPAAGATPFRSFGTHGIWFPRGLLLRRAARQACARLLAHWQETGPPTAQAEVESACARMLADPDFRLESICTRLQEEAAAAFDGSLTGALTSLLASLEEQSLQSVAQDDPANWSPEALHRLTEWVGTSATADGEASWRRSKLGRALAVALQKLTEEWDQRLAAGVMKLMDHPGRRVAAAESAFETLDRACQAVVEAQTTHLEQQFERTRRARQQLERALENCRFGTGGFSIFGNRARRVLQLFMDHLAAYGRQRLVEEVVAAGLEFFQVLGHRIREQVRHLSFCRQRLHHLQEIIDQPDEDSAPPSGGSDSPISHLPPSRAESYWETIRESKTTALVLPDGEEEIDGAMHRFVATLTAEQWTQLDQSLQEQVLNPLGGLHAICTTGGNLPRHLGEPLLTVAAAGLANYLPVTDVAQVTLADAPDLSSRVQAYFEAAAPLVAGPGQANQRAFLLIPTSDAGKDLGQQARRALTQLELVLVPGQADLMFCREQGYLSANDFQRFLRACRAAYQETANVPNISPHSRFDILDWMPLDPSGR